MLHFFSSPLCFSSLIQGSLGNGTVNGTGETIAAKREPTVNRIPVTAGCSQESPFMEVIGLVRGLHAEQG